MKHLLAILSLVILASCSKTSDVQYKPSSTVEDLRHHKPVTQSKSVSYTYTYEGNCDVTMNTSFPAWDNTQGTIVSWKVNISRHIKGTATLVNSLNKRNDSALIIMRYSQLFANDDIIPYELPSTCMFSTKQRLPAGATMQVPIDVIITDTFNCRNLADVASGVNGLTWWSFRDLLDVNKSNCSTSSNLTNTITVTLIYNYTPINVP